MSTTSNQLSPLPSLAKHSQSSDMSPLTAILSLIVLIAIPVFIYAFFFAINCPRNIPRLRRLFRSSGRSTDEQLNSKVGGGGEGHLELVSGIRYSKDTNGEEFGSECPVCLSGFVDGDSVKQLNSCKHSFHVACIDKWLYSHSSCPVCRASVPVKPAFIPNKRPSIQRGEDLQQGLPDAASLV